MSENEDLLLEFFVSLPQLKQVASDKEELVTSIGDIASKSLSWSTTMEKHLTNKFYMLHLLFVFDRKEPSDGATA